MTETKTTQIHSLALECPVCGKVTNHRVVHTTSYKKGKTLRGLARCNDCKHTHEFSIEHRESRIRVVLSEGSSSTSTFLPINPHQSLAIGDEIEVEGRWATITKLETAASQTSRTENAKSVRTIWAVLRGPVKVKISLVRGSQSMPFSMEASRDQRFTVGGRLYAGGETLFISGIRVKGITLLRDGQSAEAGEIQRLYTRLTRTPPPGSRD